MPDPVAEPADSGEAHVHPPRPVQGIKPPPPLCTASNIAENWKLFKQKWTNYAIITQLSSQPQPYQVALLLHTVGDDALRLYNGFSFASSDEDRTVEEIMEAFTAFAVGTVNITYERAMFNRRDQQEGENFESFLAALRSLIKTCSYCTACVDSILRDRIVLGVRNKSLQEELLRIHDVPLQRCIEICKAFECANSQSQAFQSEVIHQVSQPARQQRRFESRRPRVIDCKYCGSRHPRRKEDCPAWGKICTACGKRNHFAKECQSEQKLQHQVSQVDQAAASQNDDVEWINGLQAAEWINVLQTAEKAIYCDIIVNNHTVKFQVDNGSTANTIPMKYVTDYEPYRGIPLKCWNTSTVEPLGKCRLTIQNPKNNKRYSLEFIVTPNTFQPLLSHKASVRMELIEVKYENIAQVAADPLIEEFSEVFTEGLGRLPGVASLTVDETVRPSIMPARRVPISIRPRLRTELDRLESLGVISKIEEPTPWLSQLVITTKKSGDIRVCMDPRNLNKALRRERFTIPTLEDTLHQMGNSRVFSKVDLASGFWHVLLDEPSSRLTCFQTDFGRYIWKVLPFGLSVSSEIFQRRLLEALEGLSGITCIADDITIHGRNKAEHDENLRSLLQRCKEKGIRLNPDKLELRKPEITFMGHQITQDGLRTDPEKVRAIVAMDKPKNVEELRRFLGMINYLSKFIQNASDLLQPLHVLTKKDVPWMWSTVHDSVFMQVKQLISSTPVLAFYDPSKTLTIENDASGYGIGSAMLQDGKPIAFASRTLTETETRYATIEKEMLAVVYGLEKNHHYTYGRHVKIFTDHKPLVSIVRKPLNKASKRLQGLLLRAQAYDYELIYRPGTTMVIADTLSRAPVVNSTESDVAYVNNLSLSPVGSERLEQIRKATRDDTVLRDLMSAIVEGWPNVRSGASEKIKPYFHYRDELTVQDGIVLRGDRIVIPNSMRQLMKQKVHAGHLGINSCLRRARDLIFWPGMSAELRQYVETCDTCARFADRQPPEPLTQHAVPMRSWEKVGTDLFTIHGKNYLVTVDYLSGFIELDYLQETSSDAVIGKLKQHFARYGIPNVVVSDGGPQFSSELFKSFARCWDFKHEMSSPGHSQANGAAESAVKRAKNLLRKCKAAREDPYLGMLAMRNTPTDGVGCSPAQILLGRRVRTMVPATSNVLNATIDSSELAASMDEKKMRVATRQLHRRALPDLHPGDTIRVQPLRPGEREWEQATVNKQLAGRSYEITTDRGRKLRRNRQFLRRKSGIARDGTFPSEMGPDGSGTSKEADVRGSPQDSFQGPPGTTEDVADLTDNQPYSTRSGRVIKAPKRLIVETD